MPAIPAQELFDETTCIACLGVSDYDLLRFGLLSRIMSATPTQTLFSEANCYECFGPMSSAQLLTLAQLRRWLLSLDPSAEVDPQSLVDYAKCFACLGNLSVYDLMSLALLDQISQLT